MELETQISAVKMERDEDQQKTSHNLSAIKITTDGIFCKKETARLANKYYKDRTTTKYSTNSGYYVCSVGPNKCVDVNIMSGSKSIIFMPLFYSSAEMPRGWVCLECGLVLLPNFN